MSHKKQLQWAFRFDFSYLFLLNTVLDLLGGGHMCPEQANGASEFWVQNVAIFVSDHQVQIQIPCDKNKKEEMTN